MKIFQHATLSDDPTLDFDAATKRYVDQRLAAAGVGIFVTGVDALTGNEQISYVPNTVPANKVVSQAVIDTFNPVRISVVAEGGAAFYSPTVRVDVDPLNPSTTGTPCTLSENVTDYRFFAGYADINMTTYLPSPGSSKIVYVWSDTGSLTSVNVVRAEDPPQIQTVTFGAYPIGPTSIPQTSTKGGDVMTVSGTVSNNASVVELVGNSGAVSSGTFTTGTVGGSLGAVNSGGVGFRTFTIQFTVDAVRTGSQVATTRAKNAIGTYGSNFNTTNSVSLDQTYPSFTVSVSGYPGARTALKTLESATLNTTGMTGWTAGTDAITYVSTTTGLTFADTGTQTSPTYGVTKTIDYVGSGYIESGTNLSATATRLSNGAQTLRITLAKIAAVAPTAVFTISGSPTRLRSSVAGIGYTVNIVTTQELPSAPSVSVSSGLISAVTGSNKNWSFTLTINDTHPKGNQTFTIGMINRAGIAGSSITSGGTYIVGGFTSRTVTVDALEQVVNINTLITIPTNVSIQYAGTLTNLTYRGSDLSQFQNGWSLVDGTQLTFTPGTEPFQNYSNFVFMTPPSSWLFLTDAAFMGSNTSGTLQVTIEETA